MTFDTESNQLEIDDQDARLPPMRSQREIIGRDTRKRRRNTNAYPFRYICQLSWPEGLHTMGGSGILVGPRTILTAGHNLVRSDPTPAINRPQDMKIVPGRDGARKPFGETVGARFILPPGFIRRNASGTITGFRIATRFDYAIVHLKDPLGSTAGYWGQNPRPSGDSRGSSITGTLPLPPGRLSVNLSGYPVDKPWGTQWSAFNRLQRRQNGLLLYENDTFGGHSGSPVWVTRHSSNGGRNLVGVHIRRFRVGGRPTFNAAVHLGQKERSFVSRNTR